MEDVQPYDTVCGLANVRPTKDRNKCNGNESKQDINTWQITEVSDSTKQHADDGVRSPQFMFYIDLENRYKRWPFRWYICETGCFCVLSAMVDKVISLWLLIVVSLKHYAFDQKYFFRKLENFPEGPTGSLAKIISLITYYIDDWSLLKQLWD